VVRELDGASRHRHRLVGGYLRGDLFDFRCNLERGVILGKRSLHGHDLHHVAFNFDLAAHERLHARRLILLDEYLPSRLVVRGHSCVGVLEGTEFHVDITRRGVHVGPHSAFPEWHMCDDLVDTQGNLDSSGEVCILGTNRARRVHPFF